MRSWVALVFVLVAAILACPSGVSAQPPGEERSPDYPSEIEVLGQREIARQVFKDNLRDMTERLSVFESMPRFFEPLCLEVAGLEADQARFVAERILATSRELGLGEPRARCRANAVVIVVDDPERMYKRLVNKRLDLVGVLPFRDVHTRRIENEVRAGQPVVWWSVLSTMSAQGVTFNDLGLAVSQNPAASRTSAATYRPRALTVVMYDARKLDGATLEQIADHAALHILGMPRRQIDFSDVDLPSMLTLFADGPETAPRSLTDFDRAYLQGLYGLGPDAFQSRVPRAVVAAYADQCEAQQRDCRIRLRN